MSQYLARFITGLTTTLKPLADLLKAVIVWHFYPAQEKAFTDVKIAIAKTHLLAYYDPHSGQC